MREPGVAIAGAIARDEGGLAFITCPDLDLRDWLVREVESLVPSEARPFRTSSVAEALGEPNRMALIIPNDEAEVVRDLDACRDQALEPPRTQPIVLFLLRDGDGHHTLALEAPSAWSWAGGSDVDPEALAELDMDAEREAFTAEVGTTPEEWLVPWRSQDVPRTQENFTRAFWAMTLE